MDEVGGELRTVGDEHEVARAGSERLRLRVEEQRGQDAEGLRAADVRDDHARALRGGAELPARIGEPRVRRERRARRMRRRPRNASAEPIPGLFHSGRNQASPVATGGGARRVPGGGPPARTHPAPSSATAPTVESPVNQKPGSWRAILNE